MTAANVLVLTVTFIISFWLKLQLEPNKRVHFLQAIVITIGWLGFIFSLSYFDILSKFDFFPPPILFFFITILLFSFFLAFSKFGTALLNRVSLSGLILFQSFRFLAELTLFLAFHENLAPRQMTIEGDNFDIVTAVLALALGLYLRKKPNLKMAFQFNVVGLIFLAIVVFIAITSMPTPIRVFFTGSNVWVTKLPYVLLPGVLVVAALADHLLIFRKIKQLKV